jgi:hypothetical protein
MKVMFPSKLFVIATGLVLSGLVLNAQNTIKLFSPINNRTSPTSAGFGPPIDSKAPYSFGSTTVSLSCAAGATASLSGLVSDSNPQGNLMVDNNILVSVTQDGASLSGPTNVCTGGVVLDPSHGTWTNHCFQFAWEDVANGSIGQNPDLVSGTYGVAPLVIDNSVNGVNFSKPLSLTVGLEDEGGLLLSSTIILTTSCTINGVSSGTAGGNPITDDSGRNQNFSFNPLDTKKVDFTYDISGVTDYNGDHPNGSIPQTTDSPIDETRFRPDWVAKTPFATSSCFVHNGEVGADGITPACKLYTLECISPDGSTITGANCPKSTKANEKVVDHFDGPALLGLPNIYNTAGKLIAHQGVGFLMASEDWAPALPTPAGQCTFEAASGLSGVACPQNLLRDFSGPGVFSGTGLTANPNSTFISIYGVPQPLTVATLQGSKEGNWINTNKPQIGFVTTAPNFTAGAFTGNNVPLAGAANFIPAPIKGITYGISTIPGLPTPLQEPTLSADFTVLSKTCPVSFSALTQPNFAPPKQTVNTLPDGTTPIPDGKYLVHYYAQDCAGTQELQFTTHGDSNGEPIWATSFYTIPVNVDTHAPAVAILNVVGPYVKLNSTVYAQFQCIDPSIGSGVTHCGSNAFATESTNDTGVLQMKINTSSLGLKTLTIVGSDGAGNSSSATTTYTVTKQ